MSATITKTKQANTRRGLKALFGAAYDPKRCGYNCTHEGVKGSWQCGHPNGKGSNGLFCGRHS
jgi:hypothetical protein